MNDSSWFLAYSKLAAVAFVIGVTACEQPEKKAPPPAPAPLQSTAATAAVPVPPPAPTVATPPVPAAKPSGDHRLHPHDGGVPAPR